MKGVAAAVIGLLAAIAPASQPASEVHGRVLFSGLAVPGATVTVRHSVDSAQAKPDRPLTTVSDDNGVFAFANVEDGVWTLRVEMRGFAPVTRDVALPLVEPSITITLTMLSLSEMGAKTAPTEPTPTPAKAPSSMTSPPGDDEQTDAAIINGSTINGAASVFAQPRAFGNNRPPSRAMYTGALNSVLGNSAWNARPFSFTSAAAPAPSYADAQIGFTLGGPLKIPGLITNGPQMTLGVQHNLSHVATTQLALMPTAAERAGDFSGGSIVTDPATGLPFAGNMIPPDRISPQATALLGYYPPFNGPPGGSVQAPLVSTTKQDNVQLSLTKAVTVRSTVTGQFSYQRNVTDSINLFNFADATRQSTLAASLNWTRRVGQRTQLHIRYQFSRAATDATPFFANRTNASADAGIARNSQQAADWGPPALSFPDIAGLSDAQFQHSTDATHAVALEALFKRGRHNITIGGDARRSAVDGSPAANPRGSLTFTGAATGTAFADFLLGLPAASAIAFRTDAHLSGPAYDAYFSDDFRIGAGLTLNLGVRWEYEAPFIEASGHLANLDVAPDFTAVSPVVATDPIGAVTSVAYPRSLIRPDKLGFEPRLSTSWRPILSSSLVIRGSYGLYRNLGVYRPLAILLADQPPFSRTLSVQDSPTTPLTLANPFPTSTPGIANTYAIDPAFNPGYVHAWQAQVQRDLPGSLTVLAVYDGAKGFNLMQAFLPNTYPPGSAIPTSAGPSGFVYVTSHGNSLRNALQLTLRRRLSAGLTASVQYTLSKATDDAATFSNNAIAPDSLNIAQDWLHPGAERGPSAFDRRHQAAVQFQYTTGVGVAGGTLVDGFWGGLFKDWTITSQLNAGSGLPLTPIVFTSIPGTGVVGVRPSLTGVSPAPVAAGSYANAAAFAAAAPGAWGDAGRNSIRGPGQFSLDASLARVFRLRGRLSLEWRVTATNVLNRVTFATVDTVITSPQFGLPTFANAMRRIQTTFRFRF